MMMTTTTTIVDLEHFKTITVTKNDVCNKQDRVDKHRGIYINTSFQST